ncbi:hypothetical protein [Kitasatospora griseola]|uniref:hypothetical protein n=1 Tax=Kitasatospora griseola TaxID=2064 RepID=UPI0016717E45|nr:hypothetical protein [Kitasatospora griseola]GGR05498.1 hypothetical protein GCM10010195_71000 [Kitasatospora griseola]
MSTPSVDGQNGMVFHPTTLKWGRRTYSRHPEPASWCCHGHVPGLDPAAYRRAVSVHEAGHTVIAFHVGMHVKGVEIVECTRDVGCGPRLELGGAVDPGPYELADSEAVKQLVAGERAEQRWLREMGLWTQDRGWAAEMGALQDRDAAIPRLRTFTGSDDLRILLGWYATFGDQAEEVLDRHWPAVLAVAEALDEAGELTGDQVAALTDLSNPAPA